MTNPPTRAQTDDEPLFIDQTDGTRLSTKIEIDEPPHGGHEIKTARIEKLKKCDI